MPELTIVHEIRFSAEAMVLMERLAASLAALLQPPTPPRLAVQTEAPGVSAPAPICEASPPPAEGPSRAAGGTGGGRSQPTPAAPFDATRAVPQQPKRKRVVSPETLEKLRFAAAKGRAALAAKRAQALSAFLLPDPMPAAIIVPPETPAAEPEALPAPPTVAPPPAPPIQAASRSPRSPIVPIDRIEIMRRIAAIKPAAVDPGKPKGEPILASQETIRNWAMTRGLDMGRDFDIDVVNRKAAGIGHPGFILRTRPG